MKFTLEEPIITYKLYGDLHPISEDGKYKHESGFEIAHVKEQNYEGFKSVHKVSIFWNFQVLDKQQQIVLDSHIEHVAVLLYKHDVEVFEKFRDMLMTAHFWASSLLYRETELILPEVNLDEAKLKETTDALFESDNP